MRVKRQHQRRTLLHDPHPCMVAAMDPALMTFGTLEPTLQIHIVFREIGRLTLHKQPQLKTAHHLGKLLVHGVTACLPLLPQRDELYLTLLPCGFVARLQEAINCSQVLDIVPHLRQGFAGDFHAAVHTTGQTLHQRLCTPPFLASRVRSSDARTSCNASLIRKPGGSNRPPWSSLSIPRTAAQYPNTTSPASSSTSRGPITAQAVVSRA